MEKREPSYTVGATINWYSPYGEQYGGSLKNKTTLWSSNPTPEHVFRENCNSKRNRYPRVHCSNIYNSQDMEATWMSINREMDKDVIHIYNEIFSSVQSLSCVQFFGTPWIAARQASLFITNSRSSLKLTSIESVVPSSHLILCRHLFLLPPIPPSIESFPMSQLFTWGGQRLLSHKKEGKYHF